MFGPGKLQTRQFSIVEVFVHLAFWTSKQLGPEFGYVAKLQKAMNASK